MQISKSQGKEKLSSRIKEFEEELSTTKYNKRTQGHIGLLKAKIARLKEEQTKRSSKGKSVGYDVKRTGDATAIIVGFPSVGKSTLLNALTNAESKIGHYAFTTLTCIPGLLEHNYAKIQLLDVPGVVSGAASGKGRGKEVLACAHTADLVIILVDVFHPEHLYVIKKELHETNLRINQEKPNVKITKKPRGGIEVLSTVKQTKIDNETIKKILGEFRLDNAAIVLREEIDAEQIIDCIEGNKKYIPAIVVLNKIDMVNEKALKQISNKIHPDICISAEKNISMDKLKDLIYNKLSFIKIFCKQHGKKADLEVPLIIKEGSTLKDVCLKLHRDFVSKFKFARIWGKSVKFSGMKIRKLEHVVKDGDIVELRMG